LLEARFPALFILQVVADFTHVVLMQCRYAVSDSQLAQNLAAVGGRIVFSLAIIKNESNSTLASGRDITNTDMLSASKHHYADLHNVRIENF